MKQSNKRDLITEGIKEKEMRNINITLIVIGIIAVVLLFARLFIIAIPLLIGIWIYKKTSEIFFKKVSEEEIQKVAREKSEVIDKELFRLKMMENGLKRNRSDDKEFIKQELEDIEIKKEKLQEEKQELDRIWLIK